MFGLGKNTFGGDRRTHRQEIGGTWGGYTKLQNGLAMGLVAGTQVATSIGWRSVEAIAIGDEVLTFDRGMQPVRHVTRGLLWRAEDSCPEALWPMKVPAGALGNLEEMVLLSEQSILVESDSADAMLGDPFALFNSIDLVGFRGIERVRPVGDIEVIQLQFDDDEIVFAAAGALIFCPSLKVVNMSELLSLRPDAERYMALDRDTAEALITLLIVEDAEKALPIADQPVTPDMMAFAA